MAYADGYSRDPAANSSPPPLGAPQGGVAVKRLTATMRVAMAAIAECWGGAADGSVGVRNLRGMAAQAPDAVAITGGRIGANVVLEGGTALVWGLSPQQFYDVLYPLGSLQWFAAAMAPVVPPIIVAQWQQVPGGYAIVSTVSADVGTATPGSWQTDDQGAISAWTGATAGATLTAAQVPALTWPLGSDPGGNSMPTGLGQNVQHAATASAAHTHAVTVPGVPAHHHTLAPPRLALAAWKRIS